MDEKDFDQDELKALRGGRRAGKIKKEDPASTKKSNEKDSKGIPPLVPVVKFEDIGKYMEEERKPEDAFGFEKSNSFDAELNELALKEVAAERGITVEELLATQGKKLNKKLEPVMSDEKNVVLNASELRKQLEKQLEQLDNKQEYEESSQLESQSNPGLEELELELELIELKKKELEMKKKIGASKDSARVKPPEQTAAVVENNDSVLRKKVSNPIIQRMRQKLSLDAIKPASVELEGIKFELVPPPSALHPWIIDKIKLASEIGEEALVITIKSSTVASSILRIEGHPVAEVLGLVPEGSVKNPLNPDIETRLLTSQTIWEMISGTSSIEGLFSFSPQVVLKLYDAYQLEFKDQDINSSLDPELHRYICEVPDCKEQYDVRPAIDGSKVMFCRAHGIPMKDLGLTKELKSLPLV